MTMAHSMVVVLLATVAVHQTTIVLMSLEMVVIVRLGIATAHLETAIPLLPEVSHHALLQTTAHLVMAVVLSEVETEEVVSEEAVLHAATGTLAEAVTSVADIDNG